MLVSAIAALREAIELFEASGDSARRDSAAQYLALALYEQGDADEAVQIWEDLVAGGWDRPTTMNFLVRHYRSLGEEDAVERIYADLKRAKERGDGFFAPFDPAAGGDEPEAQGPPDAPTLLVADNDPAVRKVLGRILENEGYRVLTAEDGRQALAALFQASPDLVFLDIYMPLLSGLDVMYRLRAENLAIPVVVISGRPHATMVQDAQALGARFVHKPLNFEEILRATEELLGRHSAE
jgi:CheY-like chemotaxis protein